MFECELNLKTREEFQREQVAYVYKDLMRRLIKIFDLEKRYIALKKKAKHGHHSNIRC